MAGATPGLVGSDGPKTEMVPSHSQSTSPPPTVTLPTSTNPSFDQKLTGIPSVFSSDVEEFRGIPYGTIPSRWQHSLLRRSLPDDNFDASRNGSRCTQPPEPNNTMGYQSHLDFPLDVTESETECLTLFVTRPSPAAMTKAGLGAELGKLPVYLYIHGGAFAFGAGTDPMWNPSRLVYNSILLRSPFIAVHINYRLNVFGFAASSDIVEMQSGGLKGCNFGLRDQRTGIEWTYRNINAFGGDPSRITIGGQSAGASSVHAHVLDAAFSPGRPLFNGAIIQSGAVGTLGPMPFAEAEERWQYLCKYFEVHHLPPDQRVARMLEIPVDDLQAAAQSAGWHVFPLVDDGLTISGKDVHHWHISLGTENMVPHTSEQKTEICVLIGDTDTEGSIWRNQVFELESLGQIEAKLRSSQIPGAVIEEIKELYQLDGDTDSRALQERVLNFLTDVTFGLPVHNARICLSSSSGHQDANQIHPTRALAYRVRFGNPFPGPLHNIAQHCVDLIYIYDCFHDHLRMMDSAPEQSDASVAKNADLVDQLQADWIAFITNKDRTYSNEHAMEDAIVTYGLDRKKTTKKMDEDEEYIERKVRLEALRKHWPDAVILAAALRGP